MLARVPGIQEALAEQLVRVVASIRELELKKAPSIGETIDWAQTLLHLSVSSLDEDVLAATMPVLLKYRTDLEKAASHLSAASNR